MPDISGSTRFYAVLGDPVAQVKAPGLVNPLLAGLGIDAVMLPVRVPSEDLAGVVRGLTRIGNLDGLLITVPHKAAICELADELGPTAALCGSANVMRRRSGGGWLAENFDGTGFVRGLEAAGHAVAGTHVGLVGAGGAGSAIAVALLANGVAQLSIREVDGARLASLVARLESRWPGQVRVDDELSNVDLAVNATPLGLRPLDPLPMDVSVLRPDAVVVDIIMKPRETALLRAAAGLGLRVHHGIHMLTEQLPLYREFFSWV